MLFNFWWNGASFKFITISILKIIMCVYNYILYKISLNFYKKILLNIKNNLKIYIFNHDIFYLYYFYICVNSLIYNNILYNININFNKLLFKNRKKYLKKKIRKYYYKSIFFYNKKKYKKYNLFSDNFLINFYNYNKPYNYYWNFFYFYFLKNIKNIKHTKHTTYIYLFNIWIQYYLLKITKNLFYLKLYNMSNLISTDELLLKSTILKKITPRKFKFYYFEELTEMILVSFLTKNIKIFCLWIKKNLEKRPLLMFKEFIYYVNRVLLLLIWKYKYIYNIKGYFLKFKGKFIKGGGRKKKKIFKHGQFTSTKKNLAIIHRSYYIRTISGSIGFYFKISF